VNEVLHRYPRTHHLEGSRRQPGDEDLDTVAVSALGDGLVVVEEKLDGANAAFSFTADGALRLQSRGHFLAGGARERHFDLFKVWGQSHHDRLWDRIGDQFVVYGEWLYAKHTIFYDALPHYFLEFDVLDRRREVFLSTAARQGLLTGLPLASVPVLWEGARPHSQLLEQLVGRSRGQSEAWPARLEAAARKRGLDVERVRAETDGSGFMEGLYVKVEAGDVVLHRFKFIRSTFLTSVLDSRSHWLARPIVPNELQPGVDLFGDEVP